MEKEFAETRSPTVPRFVDPFEHVVRSVEHHQLYLSLFSSQSSIVRS